uniref:Uncharacterized protein n=1 Tax=Arundo donax TaxID=35708 RepID=A0A0A9GYC7_ARUDO
MVTLFSSCERMPGRQAGTSRTRIKLGLDLFHVPAERCSSFSSRGITHTRRSSHLD